MTGEHEHHHRGERPPGHDAAHWDERYGATDRLWSGEPNATVAETVAPMTPGRALDVGAGEGRHAVWLAGLGWTVTAVDFSAVGIDRGRAAPDGSAVEWVVADVRTWEPPAGTAYDLVLAAYLHLADDVFARIRTWLAPGGSLVVLGHALRNLTDGVGGPQDPRLLHTEEQLREAAAGLRIERLGEVLRPTAAGAAIDLLLVAQAPLIGREVGSAERAFLGGRERGDRWIVANFSASAPASPPRRRWLGWPPGPLPHTRWSGPQDVTSRRQPSPSSRSGCPGAG